MKVGRILWPHVNLYQEQRETVYSVWLNDKTIVHAGHELGKDFVAAFIILVFFLTREPCRVLSTSVNGDQLEGVLWGEIKNLIQQSKYPLSHEQGGPLIIQHMHIKKILQRGEFKGKECPLSYIVGRVAKRGEAMAGHHIAQTGDGIPRTLFVGDEASGLDDEHLQKAETWANRELYIGNPYECENSFKWGAEEGDVPDPEHEGRYYRKVIHISGEDSPNVKYAKAEIEAGRKPSHEIIIPGILPYHDYLKRLNTWDEVKLCVALFGNFWKGADILMFPPNHLDLAEARARQLRATHRKALAIGVDTGNKIAMTAVDRYGIIEMKSEKRPDTQRIPWDVVEFGKRLGVPPEMWCFDLGGGGKEHADLLRAAGYPVQTVAFAETVTPDLRHGQQLLPERKELREERCVYKNRRAQMYGQLMIAMEPREDDRGRPVGVFGMPPAESGAIYRELRRQLSKIPKKIDAEGRLYMIPKDKPHPKFTGDTIMKLLGCSPDEADSVVIAYYQMTKKKTRGRVGAAI